jgi:hypothetical protein
MVTERLSFRHRSRGRRAVRRPFLEGSNVCVHRSSPNSRPAQPPQIAATGGLAVAGALPAPVQHAFSQIGIGSDPHHSGSTETFDESSTTTLPDGTTVTSMPDGPTPTSVSDNHGGNVSGVAHDSWHHDSSSHDS